ncbi:MULTISPECIES: DNA mismatch repair protein MutS [Prochlorococcus]|uniref:DNA mismatch repair protein MutS n=1 Tax=Prochlorococcus TaxID=1218 RepID=UPI000533B035|nr:MULTISPECIES: DNA mismatch repair protein MutS [Prochlorococcus]KGG13673.1 DNA mismatch repair protein MutS [Prochlorococcus sp. MIT 0601]
MADEVIPVQGSFFDQIQGSTAPAKGLQRSAFEKDEKFSDEDIKKAAKERPRLRKGSEVTKDIEQTGVTSYSNKVPPSHHHHDEIDITKLPPVLRHYVELKQQNPARILLYRLGDFFECFFEDAILLSQTLELTLTGKEAGKIIGRVPMAGIPHHAAERYCCTLIQKGFSIALCDQLESSQNKEGKLLKRGITRILTPGTVIETGMLQAKKNNWLAAVLVEKESNQALAKWGLANADISTGEFFVKEGLGLNALEQELSRIEASEVICEKLEEDHNAKQWCPEKIQLTQLSKTSFNLHEAKAALKSHYKITTINGLGIHEYVMALRAAGGLLAYLNETNPINQSEKYFTKIPLEMPKICFTKEALILDAQTRRNLEIVSTQKDGKFQGSLLWAIDRTLTAMGGRCLRRWLENPLIDPQKIIARQEIVSYLVEKRNVRKSLRQLLKAMADLERLSGRASTGHAGGRDLVAIADGIERLPLFATTLKNIPGSAPRWLISLQKIDKDLLKVASLIRKILINNPPLSLSEGGLIHDGVDPILDGLRNMIDDQNDWLNSQEILEKKMSNIQNLKLQYHRTFGYFLSVNKSKAQNVPSHWIRRQTLSNEERFITPDLKAREGKIFQLKARSAQREYELFSELRQIVGDKAQEIRKAAKSVAGLDALTGLAELAAAANYCAPTILEKKSTLRKIHIEDSRHPVVEQMLVESKFQPNDIRLGEKTDLIVLTGPNASGKSCFLRQIGLIQLLAQIGSWIPAKEACISIADRVFTRVGAVDDLAAGQSTFMVEMTETAYILNQATAKSLVLLDEIGRGTSTFDGLSIAWAVSEFLAKEIKSRTIFATHYHELNSLSKEFNNVANFQVLVKQSGKEIHFLHKVVEGGANKSYGIEAARLAGVPNQVIKKAKEILLLMEKKK